MCEFSLLLFLSRVLPHFERFQQAVIGEKAIN